VPLRAAHGVCESWSSPYFSQRLAVATKLPTDQSKTHQQMMRTKACAAKLTL